MGKKTRTRDGLRTVLLFWSQLQILESMRALGLKGLLRKGFFWKKSTPPKNQFDETVNAVKTSSSTLTNMVQNIKKLNETKDKLLPAQQPRHKGKLTVVLELDEVLAYTFTPDEDGYLLAPLRNYDFYTEFEQYRAYLSIYKRKNLDNFLNYLAEQCEPVVWSTGVPAYVDLMMKYLDPLKKIPYVLSQSACDAVQDKEEEIDIFTKDLQLLGRDMSRVVYIDCKPINFWLYPENCMPVEEFMADQTVESQDLNPLIAELESLQASSDVRKVIKEKYAINQILKDARLL